jgi:hypothetical protein
VWVCFLSSGQAPANQLLIDKTIHFRGRRDGSSNLSKHIHTHTPTNQFFIVFYNLSLETKWNMYTNMEQRNVCVSCLVVRHRQTNYSLMKPSTFVDVGTGVRISRNTRTILLSFFLKKTIFLLQLFSKQECTHIPCQIQKQKPYTIHNTVFLLFISYFFYNVHNKDDDVDVAGISEMTDMHNNSHDLATMHASV